MRVNTFLKIFPIVLSVCTVAAFTVCEWFHRRDGASRDEHQDDSFKYALTSGPQLGAAVLLLYYACTFHRRGSDFAHQLIAESCVHQSLGSLLVLAVLHSGLYLTVGGCCAFPSLCPVDFDDCHLQDIIDCSKRLASIPDYDVWARSAHVVATCVLLAALSSIIPVHRFKHLHSRYRQADALHFYQHRQIPPLSPTVRLESGIV